MSTWSSLMGSHFSARGEARGTSGCEGRESGGRGASGSGDGKRQNVELRCGEQELLSTRLVPTWFPMLHLHQPPTQLGTGRSKAQRVQSKFFISIWNITVTSKSCSAWGLHFAFCSLSALSGFSLLFQRYCLHLSANLVSIHSAYEHLFIQELVRRSTGGFPVTWIGATDSFQVAYSSFYPDQSTLVLCLFPVRHIYMFEEIKRAQAKAWTVQMDLFLLCQRNTLKNLMLCVNSALGLLTLRCLMCP